MDGDEYHTVRGCPKTQDVVRLDSTTNREGLSQSPNQQEEPKMKWTGAEITYEVALSGFGICVEFNS